MPASARLERWPAPEKRIVEPGCAVLARRWYLVGHDRGRGDVRSFWLDRVVKVRAPDVGGLEQAIRALSKIRGVARTCSTVVLSTRFEGRVQAAGRPHAE